MTHKQSIFRAGAIGTNQRFVAQTVSELQASEVDTPLKINQKITFFIVQSKTDAKVTFLELEKLPIRKVFFVPEPLGPTRGP